MLVWNWWDTIVARHKPPSQTCWTQMTKATKELFISAASASSTKQDDKSEVILQLTEKFQTTTIMSERLQILTVLPRSLSRKRIQQCVWLYVTKVQAPYWKKGILSSPDPKPGHSLSPKTVDLVTDFYQSDEISRMMPGKKDFLSVKKDGRQVHVQKRLILSNLNEVHRAFTSHTSPFRSILQERWWIVSH